MPPQHAGRAEMPVETYADAMRSLNDAAYDAATLARKSGTVAKADMDELKDILKRVERIIDQPAPILEGVT